MKKIVVGLIFLFLIFSIGSLSIDDCSETSTTKECSNLLTGEKSLEIFPQRYIEDSTYLPINLKLETSASTYLDYEYELTTAPYHAYFQNDIKAGKGFRFEKDGYWFTYDLSGGKMQWTEQIGDETKTKSISSIISSIPTINENKITYPNAFLNTNLKYTLKDTQLKEEFILTELPIYSEGYLYLEYTGEIQFNNLSIWANGIIQDGKSFKTEGQIDFKNSLGEIVFFMPIPIAIDSVGKEINLIYDIKPNIDKLTFGLKIPYSFLKDSVYPVYIDPSLEVTGTTSLGGDLTYDWVNVHPGATININSTGYLNITAIYNITISGTINGNGLISTANGGTGGTGSHTGGGGGGASHNKSGGNGGAGEDAGGGSAGVTYDFYNNRTLLFTGRRGGTGGRGGGTGGYGGAALRLSAPEIKINGTINLIGNNGNSGAASDGGGGGGGGSGGKIIIEGVNVEINDSTMDAKGGSGSSGGENVWYNGAQWIHWHGGGGGGGAGGIISIFYEDIFLNNSLVTTLTGGSGGAPGGITGSAGGAGTAGTYYFEQVDNLGFSSPLVNLFLPNNDVSSSSDVIFICNASMPSNEYFLNNITLHIWNPDGSLNHTHTNSTTGQINESTFYYVFTGDGAFLWNCEAANNETESIFSFADNNRTINIFLTAPVVNLQTPTNNQIFNSTKNINFTYTATDENGIDTCSLYANFSGNWKINKTNITTNQIGLLNLTDGYFTYNILCNDSLGNENFAISNYSFIIDTTIPLLSIDLITTTAGSQTFIFNDSITETNPDSCWYSIFDVNETIDGSNSNISYVCNFGASPTVTAYGSYNLTIYTNDTANNQNQTTTAFIVSATTGGGAAAGGGSTTIIVGSGEGQWTVSPEAFQINLLQGVSFERDMLFENVGESERTILLSCDEVSGKLNLCPYIFFEEDSFVLPLIKGMKVNVRFTVDIPEDLEKEDYFANIIVEDDFMNFGVITVEGNLGTFGIFQKFIVKITSSKLIGSIHFPYFIIFIFSFAFITAGTIYGLKKTDISGKGGIASVLGVLMSFAIVSIY